MNCPNCGTPAKLVNSTVVYGKDYGPLWICGNYPKCDCYCGCHKGTNEPLGTMADKETRELRKKVHAAFDPLWKYGPMRRHEAYGLLSAAMLIEPAECHVGMFNSMRCKAALDCIKRIKESLQCAK